MARSMMTVYQIENALKNVEVPQALRKWYDFIILLYFIMFTLTINHLV